MTNDICYVAFFTKTVKFNDRENRVLQAIHNLSSKYNYPSLLCPKGYVPLIR